VIASADALDDIGLGWARPTHIADNGCNRTCLGTKIGMQKFIRTDVKVKLGNDGKSHIMARGYGTIGHLRNALFVPGLLRDLISTQQFDREGKESSTRGGVLQVWDGVIDESEVLFTFNLGRKDNLYHWRHPYEELTRPRRIGVECRHTESSNVHSKDQVVKESDTAGLGQSEVVSKVRFAVSDVMSGGEPGNTEGQNSADSKLKQIVRREIRRVVRGSRGTHTVQATVGMNPMQVIHCRLGHVHPTVALTMLRTGAATGMGYTYDECKGEQLGLCDSCMTGKTDALSVPSSETAASIELKPFESMHMDLKEMTCNSLQRNHVVTWIVDEATDMQYVYHSKDKMDKERVIEQFVREEVLPSGAECVRKLTADCDSNFLDARFRDLCQLIGTRMTLSPPHVHQSNGRAERAIGVGMKSLRTVMARYNSHGSWLWTMSYGRVIG
jgi:hypothetical protein